MRIFTPGKINFTFLMLMDYLVEEGKWDCSLIFVFLVLSGLLEWLALSVFKDGLILYSDQFSVLLFLPVTSDASVCQKQVPSSKQHCLLFYGALSTACVFGLASDSFSVIIITLIFLCLSELLGLCCVWLHSPSGIKLVIDLILQFISVAWITLQMTMCTSWNWIGH